MAASHEEVKLIGYRISPFLTRVQIALNLKGIEYEFLEEVPGTKSELLLKSNPIYKKIPVLIHAGKSICESMIIVEYVDDFWAIEGASILPPDPYDRAVARFWAAYVDDKVPNPVIRTLVRSGNAEGEEEAIEQANTVLQVLEEAFEKCSKGKSFFSGDDRIGYLDIAVGSYLSWFRALETIANTRFLDGVKFPNLVAWAERFCNDDAVKGVMIEPEKLVEFGTVVVPKLIAASAAK